MSTDVAKLYENVTKWYVSNGWLPVEATNGQLLGFRRGTRRYITFSHAVEEWLKLEKEERYV